MHDALLNDVALYVEAFYKSHSASALRYHNITHTRLVSLYALEISNFYKLDAQTQLVIQVAAWFHDSGHLIGPMEGHEYNSVKVMCDYCRNKGLADKIIDAISELIMATKMPVSPSSLPAEILCDADTFHLGTTSFLDVDSLVWEEVALRCHITIENQLEKTLHFLQTHKFYTSYCKQHLDKEKQKNINYIEDLLKAGQKCIEE